MNIIIGTALLWFLSAVLVRPLANYWLKRKLQEPAYLHLQAAELSGQGQAKLNGLATQYYILADVLVLGVAGFIGGLLGYWFLAFSFEAKVWPGIIAFILSSFIGLGLR